MAASLPVGTTAPRGLPSLDRIVWPLFASRDLFELKYGKALIAGARRRGSVPVYGTNGRCGTHDVPLFKGPGVILGRKGQGPLGVEWSDRDYWVIDTGYSLVPLRADIDIKYAYYLIKHIGLNHLKDGTSNPTLSRDAFGAQALPLPPIDQQRSIVHILGTLDDKIELNRRMNETLEAMARGLFKSWFVDFDPVRAKAEDRDPALPQPLADLFPNSFEDSQLGEIPKGWRAGSVDDEFELTMGQSPPGETYNEVGEGLPFYQGRTDFGVRFPTRRIFCTVPTRLAKKDDTLISVRAPVGDINLANESCAIGRGVAAARHKSGSRSYTYQFMRSHEETFARFEGEGTVFGSIGKKDFHAISCVLPPRKIVMEFEGRVSAIDSRIEVAEHESRTLGSLRDTLLPKLISGELRVKDAETFLERVGV